MTKQITKVVIDHESTGRLARMIRKQSGITLVVMAKRMKISVAYLSALERGQRNWSKELVDTFKKAAER